MLAGFQSFAIVPAAGRSVRMGRPKLLLPWNESTIIEQVLSVWHAAQIGQTIVVVHPDDSQLVDVVRRAGAHKVIAEPPPPQMKDSVVAALRFIDARFQPTASDAWLLAPADVPTMSPQVISELMRSHDANHPSILVPTNRLRRGHPILLPWSFAERVYGLNDDQGINALVNEGPTRFIELGPEATPSDIDTPEDFERQKT